MLVNKDTVAPTYVSAKASAKVSTNTITLKFSEPVVATSGIVKVNGQVASVGVSASDKNALVVTTGANLAAGQTYNLEILNFKDYAGNLLNPNLVTSTVTVTADVVAPVLTDVTVSRDNRLTITFDKAMDPNTLTAGTVKLLDGNSTNIDAVTSVTPKDQSSNKVFYVNLNNKVVFNNNVFNGTLVLTDSISDASGNKIATTNKSVSIAKDTVNPAVASMKFVKANTTAGANYGGVSTTNGAIVVKFNEAVAKNGAASAAGIVLVDNKGATQSLIANLSGAAVSNVDPTEYVIPLTTAIQANSGITSLTVRIPGALVNDLSLAANASDAGVNTITVEGGSSTTDPTAPVVTAANGPTGPVGTSGNTIALTITENVELNAATVLDVNNYRLDGAPLPAGTYVTISGKAPTFTATLHIPTGTISKDRSNYQLNVSGIKDAANNTATAIAFNVTLMDDVKPELSTAALNTDGTLSLGFSEKISTSDVVDADDLVITVNNQILSTAAYNVNAVSTGADAGKSVVSVTQKVYTDANNVQTLYIDTTDNNTSTTAPDATDIILATGGNYAGLGSVVDLNRAVIHSLKVKTADTTSAKDASTNGNTLKAKTEKVVK
ncbi:Ig-like domain-containing protein [Brevibacillus sp. 179-C9.3 HS]|uniref:Ig-like domain-containing protein n=1 Tax=unclassified Brevibacillus TaxID=2684853 RepID=UPI0039A2E5D7